MSYTVLFRNENIIAVEKPQGIACEPFPGDEGCLIEEVRRDIGGSPALCHRIDRNTGGIVLIALNSGTLESVERAQKERQIRKLYHAVVAGNAFGRLGDGKKFVSLKAYHFKDARLGKVYVYDSPRKLARAIETKVRPVSYDSERGTTLCEVELVTGRTHQIRAHLAHIGFPVAGDGKYGKNSDNKKLGYRYQALWARRMEFSDSIRRLTGLPGHLDSKPRFL